MSRTHRFGGYFLFCCGINSVCNIRVSIWGLGVLVYLCSSINTARLNSSSQEWCYRSSSLVTASNNGNRALF